MNTLSVKTIVLLLCSSFVLQANAQAPVLVLESFEARTEALSIFIKWQTKAGTNTGRFIIERRYPGDADYTQVWELIATGDRDASQEYIVELNQTEYYNGEIFFRMVQVDLAGNRAYSEPLVVQFTFCFFYTYYIDNDRDGYGSSESVRICSDGTTPPGYSFNFDDCDDNDPNVGNSKTYLEDNDGDGFGDENNYSRFCSMTPPPGYTSPSKVDCDDNDPTVLGPLFGYYDKDRDGYGDTANVYRFCSGILPPGFVSNGSDCYDNDPTIYRGAPELCDGKDNNCNGRVDEGMGAITAYYPDADGDGYGDASSPDSLSSACALAGYVTNNTDCDDKNAFIHPGAKEICDGKDNNCDGTIDEGCTNPAAFVSATSTKASNCLDDGSIKLTASGGTPPFMYSIDSGRTYQASSTFTGLAAGSYTGFVKDQTGTLALVEGVIVGKEAGKTITVMASTKRAADCANDGKITFGQSGGTGPYSYSLDGMHYVGTHIIRNLAPGTYTGYVKDANGCVGMLPDIVVDKLPGDIQVRVTELSNASPCIDNGVLKISITGGSGVNAFSLDGVNFGPSRVFYNVPGGHNTAYVKYARGCIAKQTIYMDQKRQIIFSARSTRESCIGAGDGIAIGSYKGGGNHPEEFQLSQNDKILVPYQTDRVFTGLAPGMYTVTVKDRWGCTASADVKVKPGLAACTDADITMNNKPANVEAENVLRIHASPNPTTNNFRVTIESNSKAAGENVEITVVDMTGRRLYQAKGNKNQVYHFGERFAAGTYSVQVRQGNLIKTQRIIKVQR
jgi:hypothetical protein